MTAQTIGIHDMAVATSHHVLDLQEIADHAGINVEKFYVGIGQTEMSVLAGDEDIVTMAAEAAQSILDRHGSDGIRTVLFATESSVDQAKSAGVYVHGLLNLPAECRVIELKQACYSATAALQFALGIIARNPGERVLVIASDLARYTLDSSGEATQGAGAIAMLVTANPDIVAIEPVSGLHTSDVHDFWRPNYRSEALVDGKFSMNCYLNALEGSWNDYQNRGGVKYDEIDRFCYHQPFSKMAVKAHNKLQEIIGVEPDPASTELHLAPSLEMNRRIGNSYTASLYVGLLSLLNNDPSDLAHNRIGFFSYGSGSVAEFFTGIVQPGYRSALRATEDEAMLDARVSLNYSQYRSLHQDIDLVEGTQFTTKAITRAPFRFAGVEGDKRQYERSQQRLTQKTLVSVGAVSNSYVSDSSSSDSSSSDSSSSDNSAFVDAPV